MPRALTTDEEIKHLSKMIGERIALARHHKHMTQEQVAEALGVVRTAVVRWESGERLPRLKNQVELCRLLDQPFEFLFGFVAPDVTRGPDQ